MKYKKIVDECVAHIKELQKVMEGVTDTLNYDFSNEINGIVRDKLSELSDAEIIWIMSHKQLWRTDISWYDIKEHLSPCTIIEYCEHIIMNLLEKDIEKIVKETYE